jgi:hypothetical protein
VRSWGFHLCENYDYIFLGYDTTWSYRLLPTFRTKPTLVRILLVVAISESQNVRFTTKDTSYTSVSFYGTLQVGRYLLTFRRKHTKLEQQIGPKRRKIYARLCGVTCQNKVLSHIEPWKPQISHYRLLYPTCILDIIGITLQNVIIWALIT